MINLKIGIDLDGVLFDSEKLYRVYTELYDMFELKKNSKVNNREVKLQKRFNWTQEEINTFFDKYQERIMLESDFMPGAIKIIKRLKEEGHVLIIITARGNMKKEIITLTQEILRKNNMDIFDKYFWGIENKEEICLKEKVDLMIDDNNENCKKISKQKIKTIYLKDAPSFDMQENEYLKTLYNWGEIYRYIKEDMDVN